MYASSENETIFCELLPEISRKYENSMFDQSLMIFLKNLKFSNDELEEKFVKIDGICCAVQFDTCLAVRQTKLNDFESMMFGIFMGDEQNNTSVASNLDISHSLQAQLILPTTLDKSISHIELRDYDIRNSEMFDKFQQLFQVPLKMLKIRQKSNDELYIHVDLENEKQTNRSTIFESIMIMFEYLVTGEKHVQNIASICLPFVHFGKIRISMKRRQMKTTTGMAFVADARIFNFYGSMFGEMFGISTENAVNSSSSETFLNGSDIEFQKETLEIDSNSESSLISPDLISILRDKMNLKSDFDSCSDLKYLGIDSIRIVELEYYILKNWPDSGNPGFLIGCKTLADVNSKIKKSNVNMHVESKMASFKIPLSSQQKRILFMKMTQNSEQFDEVVRVKYTDLSIATCRLNTLIVRHSILRTCYLEDYQYLLSATECFVGIFVEDFRKNEGNLKVFHDNSEEIVAIFDHISIDGKSLAIFQKEFLFGINENIKSKQYWEYCTGSNNIEEAEKYWKTKQLKIVQKIEGDGDIVRRIIPRGILKKMRNLEKKYSRFEMWVACFIKVLADESIGFAVDMRSFEFENCVGCFTNILPIIHASRANFTLDEVQEIVQSARRNAIYPYEKLVKLAGGELLNVLLVDDEFGSEPVSYNSKKVRFAKPAKYPMTWYLRQNSIEVEFMTSQYTTDQVNQMIDDIFENIDGNSNSKKIQLKGRKCDFPGRPYFCEIDKVRVDDDILETKQYRLDDLYLRKYVEIGAEKPVLIEKERPVKEILAAWNSGFYPVPIHGSTTQKSKQKIEQQLRNCIDLGNISGELETKRKTLNRLTKYEMAYVTCTSGSTGSPKLVATAHEGHGNLARNYAEHFYINNNHTICQTVDASFDIFFADLTKTFTNNAKLIRCKDGIASKEELIRSKNAYIMPAFLTRLSHDFEELKNIESLQFGGESMNNRVVQRILEFHPKLKLWQEYGLTEQTVYSMRHLMNNADDSRIIGKPYDNIKVEIVASNARLSGCGVMRGYFGIKKKEGDVFVDTGDCVRIKNDKGIEFVGRNDSMIKLNGFRIDLFEIESIAMSSELLMSCTCIVSSDKQLVLFFKRNNLKGNLEEYLDQHLIYYKVPKKLIELKEFPLTRTGKVDKLELKKQLEQSLLTRSETRLHRNFLLTPSSPEQSNTDDANQELLKKWLEYYSETRITSYDDDFLKMGVDSISIMLTIQKMRSFGINLEAKKFFELKTLRKIGDTIPMRNMSQGLETIKKTKKKEYHIELNHVQKRILFICRIAGNANIYRLKIKIAKIVSIQKINSIVCGNYLLRSKLVRNQGEWKFELLSATEVFYTVSESQYREPEDYETTLKSCEHGLELSIHHIICDARSFEILNDQISGTNDRVHFENAFELESQNIPYLEIPNFRIFKNFEHGKTTLRKLKLKDGTIRSTSEMFFEFSMALRNVFKINNDFSIAMTFANRSPVNWRTVSMFANTLPIPVRMLDTLDDIHQRITHVNEILANTQLRNSCDFAINFREKYEFVNDETERWAQFPILLTVWKDLMTIDFDESLVEKEYIDELVGFLEPDVYSELFRKVLKTEDVHDDTNFFETGGHSLTAMKLIDILGEQLKIPDLPIKLIFENPTPNLLKKAVEHRQKTVHSENVQNSTSPKQRPSNLSEQQLQMFYLSQMADTSTEYQLPFIQAFPSNINVLDIHRSFLCTIQEHTIYRTAFLMDNESGDPKQVVMSMTESYIPLTIEEFCKDSDLYDRITVLCHEKMEVLDNKSLIRAVFLKSVGRQIAFLHLHHLISDARSTQITNETMRKYLTCEKDPVRSNYTYLDYCGEIKKDVDIEENYIDDLRRGVIIETSKTLETTKKYVEIDVNYVQKHNTKTPFNLFLEKIGRVVQKDKESINIAFPVLNRNEKTINVCGYFLNNLVINTNSHISTADIIDRNYSYLQVIQKFRQKSNNDIAQVYLNCRYDLEYDESDEDQLLDLIPSKLHFPIEFDVDLFENVYRLTMRTNMYTCAEVSQILKEIKNAIIGRESRAKVIKGVQKDIPTCSWIGLIGRCFDKFDDSQFGGKYSYFDASKYLESKSLEVQNEHLKNTATIIRADSIIGVIGSKSIETTLSCMSVQLAGGAYLPIDKNYPPKRISNILKDTVHSIGNTSQTTRTYKTRLFNSTIPDSLAYVITTSGTTGTPKATCISAKSVVNLGVSSTLAMHLQSSSGVYQFTNFVYDNSVLEVVSTLVSQARLIYSKEFDPIEFSRLIKAEKITHCLLFPSLVQSFEVEKLRELAYWVVGGERLAQNLLLDVLNIGCRVIQNYGPTETTAFAVSKRMRRTDLPTNIGKPAINTKLRINNDGLLLIEGIGKMRGYLNKGEQFEWYNSGDLCRFEQNDHVIFEGRKDSQIKIRGFRVELGEIEKCIETLPGIQRIKAKFDEESQNIHIFYTGRTNSAEIRQHCQKFLEAHKVPSKYVEVTEFPLTGNSKIDMKKLGTSGDRNGELENIWIQLLKSPPNHDDHFYTSGGHSLLLIRLRHLIQTKLQITLTVAELLSNLVYSDLEKLIYKKTNYRSVVVFFPALYGECATYMKLVESMKPYFEIVLLEEFIGENVEMMANEYKRQIEEKVSSSSKLIFIGASAAGTFAFATSQMFNNVNVVLLDAGTYWDLIKNLDYEDHRKGILQNLLKYNIDIESINQLAVSSWKILQILKNYKPVNFGNPKLFVLSIDGTDLGWQKYSERCEIRQISGNHYTMLENDVYINEICDFVLEKSK